MDASDKLVLFQNDHSSFFNALSVSIKKRTTRIINNDFDFSSKVGAFRNLKKDLSDSKINASNNQTSGVDQSGILCPIKI